MMGGMMELDLSRTIVEIPELVFREWNPDSEDCFFRFGDGIRRYQTPTAKEATASEQAPQLLFLVGFSRMTGRQAGKIARQRADSSFQNTVPLTWKCADKLSAHDKVGWFLRTAR
jgi:hypothetical protein